MRILSGFRTISSIGIIGIASLLGLGGPIRAASNTVTIAEKSGVTTANYPVQLGRPFIQGEIPNYPQVLVGGTPVQTQADVKSRWPDGSVKHAILSFIVPTLLANSTVTVTFRDQTSGNNDGYLDATGMVSGGFDFDAIIELTNGTTQAASAKSMLQSGAFTYWLKGPVSTSVIIADHTPTRQFDLGFDNNRSFRPVFLATFWPAINKVRVRFIGEIACTESLQDQVYSLALKLGSAAPAQVYSHPSLTHTAMSRWTKEFWIGGAPTTVSIDHNLPYLISTKFVYNFDTTKVVSEAQIASMYSAWTAASKDLYDPGKWTKGMGNTGGRADIGPYPSWLVNYLYTFDNRLRDVTTSHADLAGAWPVHLREGRSTKSAVGRPISIQDRPTLTVLDFSYSATTSGDRITPVGTLTNGGWVPDLAHSPEIWSALYAITGDYWYLEELWFFASWQAAYTTPGNVTWGRGPSGAGGIANQIRSEAWTMRTRANAAFVSPDATPEKTYLTTLINDYLAIEEGARNITTTSFYNTTNWNWGVTYRRARDFETAGFPPLHHWQIGGTGWVYSPPLDSTVVLKAMAPWEAHFIIFALGRAKELGYPADALLTWVSVQPIGKLTDAAFNKYLIGTNEEPTIKKGDNKWFSTWAEVLTGYDSAHQAWTSFNFADGSEHYADYAIPAIAMVAAEPGGGAAWTWFKANVVDVHAYLNQDPKWAIVPRDNTTTFSPCDTNRDGKIDLLDVEMLVFGIVFNPPGNPSLLLKVINAILGKGCNP